LINIAVAAILAIALGTTIVLTTYTMFYCQSAKKVHFILLSVPVFLFVLGYLLEVTATSDNGGFTATKVMYLGSAFISPVFLLFASDYCEVRLARPLILIPLFLIPFLVVVLVWTTDYHSLIYTSYTFELDAPIRHLNVETGKLYYVNHAYALLCMSVTGGIIIHRLLKWDKRYRFQLILLLLGVITPVLANILFVLKLNVYGINYTPVSLVVFNVLFYVNIMRYDLFDILPKATAMALNSIKEAFMLIDADMRFLSANPATYLVMPGLSKLRKGSEITDLDEWPPVLSKLMDNQHDDIKFSIRTDAERFYSASVSAVFSRKKAIAGWIILIQDVTSPTLLLRKLEEAATKDGLTDVYNRRHFTELAQIELAKAHESAKSCYVIMFDIDHFKKINDTYGHPAGDAVLKTVAARVKGCVRPYDILGRYGGEEFIVILSDATEHTALELSESIRSNIEDQPVAYDNLSISVTASFGVASSYRGSLEMIQKHADEALYHAKQGGRNRVVFYQQAVGS